MLSTEMIRYKDVLILRVVKSVTCGVRVGGTRLMVDLEGSASTACIDACVFGACAGER